MSALVDVDDMVTALVLAAIDPAIGGVLLRGDKGSAKTTAARALASLLPEGAPFVEVPLGATEDRVVGSIDVGAILAEGAHRLRPGLLHAAHGGVLYVDEVNLLADHLVDVLLDAAATGVNRVERDGLSERHDSRFVLVGSMNPEEGELRPQLLDRFGLSVPVATPEDPESRAEAVRRRIAFDGDPAAFAREWATAESDLAARLRRARPVGLQEGLDRKVAELCVAAGAEGLRADLVICRAAAALAGWRDKAVAGEEEVVAVAPLALGHRRRTPFGPSTPDREELDELVSDVMSGAPPPPPSARSGGEPAAGSVPDPGDPDAGPLRRGAPADPDVDPPSMREILERTGRGSTARAGRRSVGPGPGGARGRAVANEPFSGGVGGAIAAGATVVAATVRSRGRPTRFEAEDLRVTRRESRGDHVVVMAVDTSGSMGTAARLEAARGAVLSLVADAYQRRDRVAVITYRDTRADVVMRPTSSTEVAVARLRGIETGGRTPLSEGIEAALALAVEARRTGSHPVVVMVTDGRATWAPDGADPVERALEAGRAVLVAGLDAVVVDCETGAQRLGVARAVSEAMGARYVSMDEVLETDVDTGAWLAGAIAASLD
ncbi:MAG: VWA domain-containing protein [Acidimicrobiales bacterium]